MDLKSFSENDPYKKYRDPDVLLEKEEKPKVATEDDVKKAVNHFSKMDNSQLMLELAKQVAIQKDKGNHEQMSETIERIKPFLNAEQKKRLDVIISSMGI